MGLVERNAEYFNYKLQEVGVMITYELLKEVFYCFFLPKNTIHNKLNPVIGFRKGRKGKNTGNVV